MSYFAGLQEDYLRARAWSVKKLATSGGTPEDAAYAAEVIDRARRQAIDWGLELIRLDETEAMEKKAVVHNQVCEKRPGDDPVVTSLEAPEFCEFELLIQSDPKGISEAARGEFWSGVLRNVDLDSGFANHVVLTVELVEQAIKLGAMRTDTPIAVMELIDSWSTEDGGHTIEEYALFRNFPPDSSEGGGFRRASKMSEFRGSTCPACGSLDTYRRDTTNSGRGDWVCRGCGAAGGWDDQCTSRVFMHIGGSCRCE